MKRRRPTPRERLAAHLLDVHGIDCDPDAIRWLRGYYAQTRADCLDRWSVTGYYKGTDKRVEVTGTAPVSECARYGVRLDPNTDPRSEYYGDFVAYSLRPTDPAPMPDLERLPLRHPIAGRE